jgi:nucleoside-diphosphate-sugar epimerase
MNILITGSAGFIGCNVVKDLCLLGHNVTGIDDVNDHYDRRMKIERIKYLVRYGYKFIKSDINNIKTLDKIFKNGYFDAVINLAARAGVGNSITNPHIYYKTNVSGVLNVLECMKKYNVKKIIHASTSSVYGYNHGEFVESMNTDRPLTPYAASKKASESLLYTYHNLYKFDVTIFRFFTVYGSFGRPDMSMIRFIKATIEGRKINLFGDGTQKRDFTHVSDICNAIRNALTINGYNIINLGNNKPVSINYVISKIAKELNKATIINYKDKSIGDIYKTKANINKAYKLLKWKPSISIDHGIKNLVNWYILNKSWMKDIKTGE